MGALLTLIIFKVELNVYSFVGLVMLVGLVKKNAIMQIDFALEQERHLGKSPAEAIYEGCLIRFRPIMMTTWAARWVRCRWRWDMDRVVRLGVRWDWRYVAGSSFRK